MANDKITLENIGTASIGSLRNALASRKLSSVGNRDVLVSRLTAALTPAPAAPPVKVVETPPPVIEAPPPVVETPPPVVETPPPVVETPPPVVETPPPVVESAPVSEKKDGPIWVVTKRR